MIQFVNIKNITQTDIWGKNSIKKDKTHSHCLKIHKTQDTFTRHIHTA